MTVTAAQLRSFAGLQTDTTVLPDSTLNQYIAIATLIVTEDLEGSGYSSDRLDAIELNLAAHYAILGQERGGLIQQKIGTSEERYQLMSGSNSLSSSRFGQVVSSLDTLGILAGMASQPLKAAFRVV